MNCWWFLLSGVSHFIATVLFMGTAQNSPGLGEICMSGYAWEMS